MAFAITRRPSWLPYSADSLWLGFVSWVGGGTLQMGVVKCLEFVFHDKYQWEIWKNTAGKSATPRGGGAGSSIQKHWIISFSVVSTYQPLYYRYKDEYKVHTYQISSIFFVFQIWWIAILNKDYQIKTIGKSLRKGSIACKDCKCQSGNVFPQP